MQDRCLLRAGVCLTVVSTVFGLVGQTRIDAGRQVSNPDFSQAPSTKPNKTGSTLPAQCSAGETFLRLGGEAAAGLYACTATNVWTAAADGGTPAAHGASHRHSGSDEVGSLIPGAYEIPKADAGGRLNMGWLASGLANGTKYIRDDGTLHVPDVTSIQANPVAPGVASGEGQFYGWDSVSNQFRLFQWGGLFTLSGGSVNLATEVIPRYEVSSTVPEACTEYGQFHFDPSGASGSKMLYCNGSQYERVTAGTPGGGVSVGLSLGGSPLFAVSGSPVTSSGTIILTPNAQGANTVFAGPDSGVPGAPTFRSLTGADIPPLDSSRIATGVLSPGRLGSGVADGSVYLRGDGAWAAPPASSAFDPLATAFEYDDFLPSTTTSGSIGKLGWSTVAETGGSGGLATSVANHMGIYTLSIGGTANKATRLQLSYPTGGFQPFDNFIGTAGWELIYVFRTTTTIDTDQYIRVGFGNLLDSASAVLNKTSNSVEASGTGNFLLKSCDGAGSPVCTTVDTGIAPAQNTWYRVRLYSDTAGTVKAQISTDGGAYSAAISTPMKINSGTTSTPIILIGVTTAVTGTRTMQMDYYQHKLPVTR